MLIDVKGRERVESCDGEVVLTQCVATGDLRWRRVLPLDELPELEPTADYPVPAEFIEPNDQGVVAQANASEAPIPRSAKMRSFGLGSGSVHIYSDRRMR